jgi:deazaflavin-dependent oxidoreductase (nitroreductase family)
MDLGNIVIYFDIGCYAITTTASAIPLSDSIGWKTAKPRRIEIWFVEHDKKYYVASERKKRAHWVQNILHNPKISFTVDNRRFEGYARMIDDRELELISNVSRSMNKKYGWSTGLIIELNPQ